MRRRPYLFWIPGVVVLFIVGLAGIYWFNNTLNDRHIAAKCERRIEATVDPASLQAWAERLLREYSSAKTNYGGHFPPLPVLKNIWDKAPPTVCILGGDDQEKMPFVY